MKRRKQLEHNTTVGGIIALAALTLAFAPILILLIPFIVIGLMKDRY